MTRLWGLLVLLMLVGCGTQMAWNKPGVTQAEFNRDRYSCERDARQSGYFGSGLAGAANMQGFFHRCMEAQGYTLEAQAAPVTSGASDARTTPLSDEQCIAKFGVKCPDYVRPDGRRG